MTQLIFSQHLAAGAGHPSGLIAGDVVAQRFSVYRNNVHHSLAAALAARFPATGRLIGAECFVFCARLYVEDHKPDSPVLMFYGDDFPDFLADLPLLEPWPFIGDVARIEAARTYSYHAADCTPLRLCQPDAAMIETLLTQVLTPHPAAHLLESSYPAGTIWEHSASPDKIEAALWLKQTVAITRGDGEVQVFVMPDGTATCFAAIKQGLRLDAALAATCARDESCDPVAILTGLLRCDLLSSNEKANENEDHQSTRT